MNEEINFDKALIVFSIAREEEELEDVELEGGS